MEMDDWKPDACPVCGSADVKRIVYGMPAGPPDDDVVPGGCVILEEVGEHAAPRPEWRCGECSQEWAGQSAGIPWRIKLRVVDALLRLLRRWLETTSELTIGADVPDNFDAPNSHVLVDVEGVPNYLAGNSTRDAVVDFLTTFDEEPVLRAVAVPGVFRDTFRVVVGHGARAIPGMEFFVLEPSGLTPSGLHRLYGDPEEPIPARPHWWAADASASYQLLMRILERVDGLVTRMHNQHSVVVHDDLAAFDNALHACPDQIGFRLSTPDLELIYDDNFHGPYSDHMGISQGAGGGFPIYVMPEDLPVDGQAVVVALVERATREDRGERLGSVEDDVERVARELARPRADLLHPAARLIERELRAVLGPAVAVREDGDALTVHESWSDECVARVDGGALLIDAAYLETDEVSRRPFFGGRFGGEGSTLFGIDLDRVGMWQREVVALLVAGVREVSAKRVAPLADFDFGAHVSEDKQY